MGYRTYIASLSKKEHAKIKGMTLQELYDYKSHKLKQTVTHLGVYDIGVKLHEFGKYTEFDDDKFFSNVFDNVETNDYFIDDYDFWIVGKEFLEHIINHYTEKVKSIYSELYFDDAYEDLSFEQMDKIINHVRGMGREWGVGSFFKDILPYGLDDRPEITTSWKYEYNIFELVRIYKSFDWENNVMIYYGY